ncbi:delta-like protein D [Anneissia japonica]|uniref:delta-like protein D n=1 Tax=Anneissia japonica TaxID=1529436 RepID=UPI0014256E14|nr:delta-like protein D [Anneissia japonica]
MDTLLLQAVVILEVVVLGLSEVVIEIKLEHYNNPSSKELDGDCCDFSFGSCTSNPCDNIFKVCLDNPGSSTSFSTCPIGSVTTARVFDGNDNFNFPSPIPGNVPNPFSKTHASWQDGFRIKISVFDYDPSNDNDEVDRIFKNIYLSPVGFGESNPWITDTVSGTRSRIQYKYRVRCQNDYYGTSCSKYCVDTDDSEDGHYTCDPGTGDKICNPGWIGESCDHDINECQSTPCVNGGTCQHGVDSYVCICPPAWGGSLCHLLQDECINFPCANNATCESDVLSDGTSNYTCTCEPGWEGMNCTDEIYECESSPCLNDGVCQDLLNGWNCLCKEGWEGGACEERVTLTTTLEETTMIKIHSTLSRSNPEEQQQSGSDGISDPVIYSILVIGLLLIIFILLLILVRKRMNRKMDEGDAMEIPVDSQPSVVAISQVHLDQAAGGGIYESSLPAKKIPFEEDEIGSFQNPVYMLTFEDLMAKNAQEENVYEECKDSDKDNTVEENPYVDMTSVAASTTVDPVPSAVPNLYFVD